MRLFALALSTLVLAGCEHAGPGDLAAGLACGARESACENQCLKEYEVSGNFDRYDQCRDRCAPSDQTLCR